jgi:exodeoxyribonuclease VII small subunit
MIYMDHTEIPADTPFSSAVAELDAILQELQNPKLDVDLVAERTERAAALVEFCRARIEAAKARVTAVR